MREKLRWLLIAGLAAAPLSASAQEHDFPALNTIGRFLGVGYSQTGYHGRRDGRFDAIKARQPAYYPSSGLSYPYDPAYRPYRPAHVSPAPLHGAQPMSAPASPTIAPELPSEGADEIQPEEVKPAKPVGPPPQWLKPHLEADKEEALDQSPSDRQPARNEVYGELTPPRQPSNKAESPFYIEPDEVPAPEDIKKQRLENDASSDSLLEGDLLDSGDNPLNSDDSLLDSGDSLLDSGDDLLLDTDDLLLDDDDLSARRYLRRQPSQPRTATKPGGKVSVLQSPIPNAQVAGPTLAAPRTYPQPTNPQPATGFVQVQPQPQPFRPQPQQTRQPVQYRTAARPVATGRYQASAQQQPAPRFLGTPRPMQPQQVRPAQPLQARANQAFGPQAARPAAGPTGQVPGYVVSHQANVRPQATGYLRPAQLQLGQYPTTPSQVRSPQHQSQRAPQYQLPQRAQPR